MSDPTTATEAELRRYVREGGNVAWEPFPGQNIVDRMQRARVEGREALVNAVLSRVPVATSPSAASDHVPASTRAKVEPMVRGLFPRAEQEAVLRVLETSVVFVTATTVEALIRSVRYDSTAWTLANLYLTSAGVELLGPDASKIVGMSEGTTCYVSSSAYFDDESPFADFIVHEAAHVFHNCKRVTAGLPEVRRRDWLLPIEYRERETFAYACEAYSQILRRARSVADRRNLAEEFAASFAFPDDVVNASKVIEIVREAVSARNGWKVIHGRCAPPKRARGRRS